ncbi:MAG TPA: polysaccharide biosynthesis tyrosine autokinase [Chryseosolibacter sp.]
MEHPNTISNAPEAIDFKKLGMIITANWLGILLIFLAVNAAAYLVIRYTKDVYESQSQLKLEFKSEASDLGIANMINDENVNGIAGEIEIIRSELFLDRVIDYSNFEVVYYSRGRVLDNDLFISGPVRVIEYNKDNSLYDVPISFEAVGANDFILQVPGREEVRGKFGKKVALLDLEMVLEKNPDFKKGDEIGYYFVINSRQAMLEYLSKNLSVEPLNFNANTIRLSFKDNNAMKARAVLNRIDSLYVQYSNEQKNLANKQKIDWLVNELSQLEKKMEAHEEYFKKFALQNKSNNLEIDFRTTVDAINKIDSQRYELTKRITEVNRFIEDLQKKGGKPSFAIRQYLPQNTNLSIDELQRLEIERERLKLSYQEVSFAYRQKQRQVDNARASVLEQVNGVRGAWIKSLEELNNRKAQLETAFATLPDKSTEFSKNQRFYKVYEESYLLLMQSKAEFEIAQAGSIPDFKILSPASLPITPISPKKLMIAGVGLVASIVLIFVFVGILYIVNNKITSLSELERIERAPLLGAVPLSRHGANGGLHILDYPKSVVSESIRTLRTNLDFFQVTAKHKVIAVSSSISGEGKSFIAMNLGGVIALSKKRVVLIDLDMRKAKVELPVEPTDGTRGMSTILIKRNTWQECVMKTSLENFDVIPSGPHPPNPSELLLNGEFTDLLEDLKSQYDFIIIDTPPVGLVTDGIMAMKRADISVYVFRANYSKKDFLMTLRRIITMNKFTNITTVLNAVPGPSKSYGYGYYEENGSDKLKSIFKVGV